MPRARVKAFAKLNLDLRVLHKRADGFHELRTIFQTISLADEIEIRFSTAKQTSIGMHCDTKIPNNLMVRAAALVLDGIRSTGQVALQLKKHIPMGSGLGGGSSDAAAVLLALPVLTGKTLPIEKLLGIACELGSDVPFFLMGGTVLGLGRGTELYPLPELKKWHGLLITPEVHIATSEAYRSLKCPVSGKRIAENEARSMMEFQILASQAGDGASHGGWRVLCRNDFESVAFPEHPYLKKLKRQLLSAGANPGLMTGSGSALFGIFDSVGEAEIARKQLGSENVHPISFVSRGQYRGYWWRMLRAQMDNKIWPPRSRYAR